MKRRAAEQGHASRVRPSGQGRRWEPRLGALLALLVAALVAPSSSRASPRQDDPDAADELARAIASAGYEREAAAIYLDLARECVSAEQRREHLLEAARLALELARHSDDTAPLCEVHDALGEEYERARARREPLAEVAREHDRLSWRIAELEVPCAGGAREGETTIERTDQDRLDQRVDARPRDDRRGLVIAGATLTGVAGALIITLTGTALGASQASQEAMTLIDATSAELSRSERDHLTSLARQYRQLRVASIALGVASSALLGGGVTLIIVGKRGRRGAVGFTPAVTPGFSGVSLVGRF